MNEPDVELYFSENLFDRGKKIKKRYDFLLHLVTHLQPKKFIEIGTWTGERSKLIVKRLENLELFIGFDLFESGDENMHLKEKTSKCTDASITEVKTKLENNKLNPDCEIVLIEGNSHETLPNFLTPETKASFDVVFMDGGHSLDTIQNDWNYSIQLVKEDGVIILDDYHFHQFDFGCRQLIDGLIQEGGYSVRYFPMVETLKSGNQMTMVAVQRGKGEKLIW